MPYLIAKRIFDMVLSIFGILMFLPLIILIAIAIRSKEGKPVFYLKKSLGKDGKVFYAVKFRSMHNDSVEITKTGKMLRQAAMDELPQLINILKGEMSFVGPRAYSIKAYGVPENCKSKKVDASMVGKSHKAFFKRTEVIPGLAGLAQMHVPKSKPGMKRLREHRTTLQWDLEYMKKRNFLLDLKIIIISIIITFKRNWEVTGRKM